MVKKRIPAKLIDKIARFVQRHPVFAWGLVVVYLLIPVDVIFDIPVVGLIDDVMLVIINAWLSLKK